MKYIKISLLLLIITFACTNTAREKQIKSDMNKAFKVYIQNNDLRKDLVTKLTLVETISYKELGEERQENSEEVYEAKILMRGTTSQMYSAKIYNLNDTVTCYFDENLKMLRLVNPNN